MLPTGYTASVQDGKITEFKDYAKACARAFGAFVSLRDEPSSADLPRSVENTSSRNYHKQELEHALDQKRKISSMSYLETVDASKKKYEDDVERFNAAIEEKNLHRQRYESMLEKAKAWCSPSSDHDGLKEFMIKQLGQSIDFDCDTSYYKAHYTPVFMTPGEWKQAELEDADHEIEYHLEKLEEDQEQSNSRNKWIEAFFKSIGE